MKIHLLVLATSALFLASASNAGQVQVYSKNCKQGKVGNQDYTLKISKPNSKNEVEIVLDLSEDGRVTLVGQYIQNEYDWFKMGKIEIQGGKKFVEVAQAFYGGAKATVVTVGTGTDEDQYDSTSCSRR